jgi:hypothetical protein
MTQRYKQYLTLGDFLYFSIFFWFSHLLEPKFPLRSPLAQFVTVRHPMVLDYRLRA